MDLSIYLITDDKYFRGRDVVKTLTEAMEEGITALQYRFKGRGTRQMYEDVKRLLPVAKEYGITFIINDRLDLVLACGAEGIHVGKEDLPVEVVRKVGGEKLIVGYSTKSLKEVEEAQGLPVDYLGFGSIFESSTKKSKVVGLEALREAVRISKKEVVAIGGIRHHNLEEVLETGVRCVAVSSAILGYEDVKKATRELVRTYRDFFKRKLWLG